MTEGTLNFPCFSRVSGQSSRSGNNYQSYYHNEISRLTIGPGFALIRCGGFMNQDQPNITQKVSGSNHTGAFVALAAGLVLALGGDAYLINRSNNQNEQLAQVKQDAQVQISKLSDTTSSLLEQERQQLQALNDDVSGKYDTANSALRRARVDAQKASAQLSAKLEEQQKAVGEQIGQLQDATTTATTKLNEDVSGVKTDVGAVRTDLSSTRSDLDKTGAELKRAVGDMGVMSGLIATNGKDLQALPIEERKVKLEELLKKPFGVIRYSASFTEEIEWLLDRARKLGLEGLIGKRSGSKYEPGRRSGDWVKIKLRQEQEFVIGGYTEPEGGRKYFGALLVGFYDVKKLMFAGRVGVGFSDKHLRDLHTALEKIRVETCPFSSVPVPGRSRWDRGLTAAQMNRCHWVKPVTVAQIKFTEWTRDGRLRQPVFLGVREDNSASEVVREKAS